MAGGEILILQFSRTDTTNPEQLQCLLHRIHFRPLSVRRVQTAVAVAHEIGVAIEVLLKQAEWPGSYVSPADAWLGSVLTTVASVTTKLHRPKPQTRNLRLPHLPTRINAHSAMP